ncbi:MAG TPA: hypothetical protein VMR37_05030 [Rhabdochlamydiaceae bacterium]|nr:hypothetical protein [Rhabdochlamydiaceae bacterium]
MGNSQTIKKLLSWMERHLNQKAEFSVEELRSFFAEKFVIKTNSRIIQATPPTYHEYLYKLKSTLRGVKYEMGEVLEASGSVIVDFVIHLDFTDKKSQKLQTISIFKMNSEHRIIEWKEVFADTDQQKFDYDPN